ETAQPAQVAVATTTPPATTSPANTAAAQPAQRQQVAARTTRRGPPLPVRAPADRPQRASPVVATASTAGGARVLNETPSPSRRAAATDTGAITTGSVVTPSRVQASAPAAPRPAPTRSAPTPKPEPKAPITFGEPVVTAARPGEAAGGVAIKLSRAPSLASLKLSWSVLQDRHRSVLQGLQARYRTTPAGVGGSAYELVAGPVVTRAEADQLCGLLQTRDVPCSISSFVGRPL
ncbi:MAG: hypothetical protein AAFR70_03875, partial [Pseudomonadota bacterium]